MEYIWHSDHAVCESEVAPYWAKKGHAGATKQFVQCIRENVLGASCPVCDWSTGDSARGNITEKSYQSLSNIVETSHQRTLPFVSLRIIVGTILFSSLELFCITIDCASQSSWEHKRAPAGIQFLYVSYFVLRENAVMRFFRVILEHLLGQLKVNSGFQLRHPFPSFSCMPFSQFAGCLNGEGGRNARVSAHLRVCLHAFGTSAFVISVVRHGYTSNIPVRNTWISVGTTMSFNKSDDMEKVISL